MGKGAALEDIPPPLAGEIAQPGQTVKGEPPKTAVRCTLDGPFPAVLKTGGDGGYIYHQSLCARAGPSGQSVLKLLLVKFLLFRGFCQLRRLFFFPVIQQGHNLFFHFGGSDLLAKILFQFRSRNNHASILLFLF